MTINYILLGILAVCSYFLGNLNWAIIISKTKKVDIRTLGSGNPGTLNMGRNFGLKVGLSVFFLDILKGVIPCLVAFFVFKDKGCFSNTNFLIKDLALYLCGLSVVLGHIYPVIFKFKGGKGIASSIGVFLFVECSYGIAWGLIVIMAIVAAIAFIYFTEFGAMASFIAITPSAISAFIRINLTYAKEINSCLLFVILVNCILFLICFFTWFAHRKNIERMLSGDEHSTSIKAMFVKMKSKNKETEKNN